jgi:hypothetical protein
VVDTAGSRVQGWRRYAALAFIGAWLGVQLAVPLVQKLGVDPFAPRYRYARYSWAMFSRPVPRFEVSIFRTRGAGEREPVPGIERYVRGYRSPAPMPMIAIYSSDEEVLDRFTRLVSTLARERHDGYAYVASIRWTAKHSGASDSVEIRADAAP